MMFSCRGFSLTLSNFFFLPFTTEGCAPGQSNVREKLMSIKQLGQSQGSSQCLGMQRAVSTWTMHGVFFGSFFNAFLLGAFGSSWLFPDSLFRFLGTRANLSYQDQAGKRCIKTLGDGNRPWLEASLPNPYVHQRQKKRLSKVRLEEILN